jgi:hypothetical protein
MGWNLLQSGGTPFNDNGGGYTYSLPGGAPGTGALEVLFVNGGDTLASVSGGGGTAWSLPRSYVHDEASYLYYRVTGGSEGSSVLITTTHGNGTQESLQFMRWSGQAVTSPLDTSAILGSGAVTGGTSPSLSSGGLAGTGELVVAFAGLANFTDSAPSGVSWSSGFTDTGRGPAWNWNAAGAGSAVWAAYDTNAGTAAVTAQASWSWTSGSGDLSTALAAFKPAPSVSGLLMASFP